jgi:hypothetical protein
MGKFLLKNMLYCLKKITNICIYDFYTFLYKIFLKMLISLYQEILLRHFCRDFYALSC